jgi:ribosomal-protein-alanine N-acetyltransferase
MLDGAERVGYGVLMMVIDEAHILNISVVAARQKGGLGRRLLEHFATLARQAGARRLLLEVRPSNGPALALYGRTGFQTIGRRKGYYPAHGGREDGLVMSLAL